LIKFAGKEFQEFFYFFIRNYQPVVVISLATLFLTLDEYRPISPQHLSSLVYFTILPFLSIIVFLRKNPLKFGLGPGNWRVWGFHLLVVFIVGIPVLLISSRFSFLEDYYTIRDFDLLKYSLETIVYMFGWEFLFRGFLLFGLKDKFKELSILVQMIPFVLLHFGKPEIETIGTIFMGIYFGYVVYRGNSYWPALIIHLFVNISFRFIVNLF